MPETKTGNDSPSNEKRRVITSIGAVLVIAPRAWAKMPFIDDKVGTAALVVGLILCFAWPAATALFYRRLADLVTRAPGASLHKQAVLIGSGLPIGIALFFHLRRAA